MFKTMLQSKARCRFDLFVRLKPENVIRYPNNSLTWCHRGDRYTQDEPMMLAKLIEFVIRHHSKYKLMELYDNKFEKNDPDNRVIVKYYEGVIEKNRLLYYTTLLPKIIFPQWLQF